MNAAVDKLNDSIQVLIELAVFIKGLEEQEVAAEDTKNVIDAYLLQEKANIDAALAYFGRPQ